MPSIVSITINDRPVSVRATATVLQACDSVGVDVPRFCYHERLSVAGNCRICLVEVQKSPKPVVACAIPVSQNRVIYTNTPLVRKAREAVLEFLLLNHPLDCPICDQGGECDLQDEAISYGSDRGRNFDGKRSVEDKECGPIVKTIMTRCIHCTRCVRFSAEVAGIEAIGAFGRGEETEIGTYVSNFLRTELSGNLVDLCPVGALTSKPYAYTARRWELSSIDGIDFFDAFGADIRVQSRGAAASVQSKDDIASKERVLRVLPRTNSHYPEIWLSDRSRYGIEGLYYNRLQRPLITGVSSVKAQKNTAITPSRWIEALTGLAPRLLIFNSSSVFLGNHINLEELYSTVSFASIRGWRAPVIGSTANFVPVHLNVESPWLWNLNHDRSGHAPISKIASVFIRGASLRFEASRLATALRREQRRRGLKITSANSFSSQRFQHEHIGASIRAVIITLENRNPSVSAIVAERTSVFLGVESLRSKAGYAIESFSHSLRKRLKVSTSKEIRFGSVHASIGSFNASALALSSNPALTFADFVSAQTIVCIQHSGISSRLINKFSNRSTFVHLATHLPDFPSSASSSDIIALPITSLYERRGHILTLGGFSGRSRSHNTTAASVGESRTLDSLWTVLARIQGSYNWRRWTETLSLFADESACSKLVDSTNSFFGFNPFSIFDSAAVSLSAQLFNPTVRSFALGDSISRHSPTIGEFSLFIENEGAFSREI